MNGEGMNLIGYTIQIDPNSGLMVIQIYGHLAKGHSWDNVGDLS